MIFHERIGKSEEIDFNKTNGSKEYMICHFEYLSDGFRYQPYACNACHDFSITVQNLSDFFYSNHKNVDYRCYIVGINKNNAVNFLNNSFLGDKGVL